MAAELLQSATTSPNVRMPPWSPSEIFRICSWMIVMTSPGTTPASAPTIRSRKRSSGKKLASAMPTRIAGKSEKKK